MYFTDKQHERLKLIQEETEQPIASIVRAAVDEWLKKYDKKSIGAESLNKK